MCKEKLVALTIDDGPNPDTTKKILDVLKKYNAHATFFCVGKKINEETAPVLKEILEAGCEIGNHGMDFTTIHTHTKEEIVTIFDSVQDIIHNYTGIYPTLFRPHGLRVSPELYDAIPLPVIGGYLDCPDWENDCPLEDRIASMRNNTVDGRIILIHDKELNVQMLETVLPEIIKKGFKVVTATELYTKRGYTLPQFEPIIYREFE